MKNMVPTVYGKVIRDMYGGARDQQPWWYDGCGKRIKNQQNEDGVYGIRVWKWSGIQWKMGVDQGSGVEF